MIKDDEKREKLSNGYKLMGEKKEDRRTGRNAVKEISLKRLIKS